MFETDKIVQYINKNRCGRPHSSDKNKGAVTMLHIFAHSAKKSVRQNSEENGVPETSICIGNTTH